MSALVVAGVVLMAAVGVALILLFGRDGEGTVTAPDRSAAGTSAGESSAAAEPSGPAGIPDATESPEGLGSDPALDVLARGCHDGDMQACDELYDTAEAGSDYETYGDTCAGRQPTGTLVYCTEAFPQD